MGKLKEKILMNAAKREVNGSVVTWKNAAIFVGSALMVSGVIQGKIPNIVVGLIILGFGIVVFKNK